jgi:hypothetical protein
MININLEQKRNISMKFNDVPNNTQFMGKIKYSIKFYEGLFFKSKNGILLIGFLQDDEIIVFSSAGFAPVSQIEILEYNVVDVDIWCKKM